MYYNLKNMNNVWEWIITTSWIRTAFTFAYNYIFSFVFWLLSLVLMSGFGFFLVEGCRLHSRSAGGRRARGRHSICEETKSNREKKNMATTVSAARLCSLTRRTVVSLSSRQGPTVCQLTRRRYVTTSSGNSEWMLLLARRKDVNGGSLLQREVNSSEHDG